MPDFTEGWLKHSGLMLTGQVGSGIAADRWS